MRKGRKNNRTLTFWVTASRLAQVKRLSDEAEISVSSFIRNCIDQVVGKPTSEDVEKGMDFNERPKLDWGAR